MSKSAFPHIIAAFSETEPGMTLRDYFAGQALMFIGPTMTEGDHPSDVAAAAYFVADAMMSERKKE